MPTKVGQLCRSSDIRFRQAIPSVAVDFCVSLLCVCLTQSCSLLKPFDEFKCHFAATLSTLVRSNDSLRQREVWGLNSRALAGPWKSLNFFPDFQGLESSWKQTWSLKVLESVSECPWKYLIWFSKMPWPNKWFSESVLPGFEWLVIWFSDNYWCIW